MGTWDVGAFDNDQALDTLAMLENVNKEGVDAFLWAALDSTYEDVAVLAIALIDIIHKGNTDDFQNSYGKEEVENNVLSVAEDNTWLRKEAYHRVCCLIEKGNVRNWINWAAREEYLNKLKESLGDNGNEF